MLNASPKLARTPKKSLAGPNNPESDKKINCAPIPTGYSEFGVRVGTGYGRALVTRTGQNLEQNLPVWNIPEPDQNN